MFNHVTLFISLILGANQAPDPHAVSIDVIKQRAMTIQTRLSLVDSGWNRLPLPWSGVTINTRFRDSGDPSGLKNSWLVDLADGHMWFTTRGEFLRTWREKSNGGYNRPRNTATSDLVESQLIEKAQVAWTAIFGEPFLFETVDKPIDTQHEHYSRMVVYPIEQGVPFDTSTVSVLELDPETGNLWSIETQRRPWVDPQASTTPFISLEEARVMAYGMIHQRLPGSVIQEGPQGRDFRLRWVRPKERFWSDLPYRNLPDTYEAKRLNDEAVLGYSGMFTFGPLMENGNRFMQAYVDLDANTGEVIRFRASVNDPRPGSGGAALADPKPTQPIQFNWGDGPLTIYVGKKAIKTSGDLVPSSGKPSNGKRVEFMIQRGKLTIPASYDPVSGLLITQGRVASPTGELSTALKGLARTKPTRP